MAEDDAQATQCSDLTTRKIARRDVATDQRTSTRVDTGTAQVGRAQRRMTRKWRDVTTRKIARRDDATQRMARCTRQFRTIKQLFTSGNI